MAPLITFFNSNRIHNHKEDYCPLRLHLNFKFNFNFILTLHIFNLYSFLISMIFK